VSFFNQKEQHFMGQAIVSVRVDSDVKQGVETFCESVGMNISTAVNIFFKAILSQRKIPFEIAQPDDDPFYRGRNWQVIQERIANWDNPNTIKITKTMEELEAMANE